jgi:hypothetical protein
MKFLAVGGISGGAPILLLVGARLVVGRRGACGQSSGETEKMKKKWEQLGLVNFLEPDRSQFQRYIHYLRIYLLLV